MSLERLKASLPGRVVQKFLADNGPVWSVSVAWGGLFALFPIILGLAALVGLALGFTGVVTQDQLFTGVLSKVPDPKIRGDIAGALDGVRRNSGILGLVGLVGLYFSATSLFGTMEQAFAAVYDAKPRSFLRSRLMGVTMMVIFAVFGSATVLTSSIIPRLNDLPLAAQYTGGWGPLVAQVIFGAAAGVILFGLIYHVVPPLKLRWADIWPGALVAGVVFELLGLIFPLYLSLNPALGIYGQFFALFFILLTYFYLLGLIIVIGVEVNAVARPPASTPADAPTSEAPDSRMMNSNGGRVAVAGVHQSRRNQMARSGFAAGLIVGGLGGLAIGYLLYRGSQNGAEPASTGSIDLTPSIELKDPAANPRGSEPVEAPPD